MRRGTSGLNRSGGLLRARLAHVGFALEGPTIFRLMFSDAVDKTGSPELREAATASFAALRTRVAAVYGEEAADVAAVSAWSFVHGLANLPIDGQLQTGIIGGRDKLETAERVLRPWAATTKSGPGGR
jgi:hypothetical protein